MDSLDDMLARRNAPKEPEESIRLKKFVYETYNESVSIVLGPHHITMVVPNAALAGALRLQLPTLQTTYNITKKILIRIS